MEHILYADGNEKKISWIIKTGDFVDEELRDQPDIYLDKVTPTQSKYIAVHVGIFWSIGRFIIKNEDIVNIMLDSKEMYDHLRQGTENSDLFIHKRTWFLNELINQRKLKVNYQLIDPKENIAAKLIL